MKYNKDHQGMTFTEYRDEWINEMDEDEINEDEIVQSWKDSKLLFGCYRKIVDDEEDY